MSIFKDNCISYLKAGYSIIPDKGQRPMVKKWNQYCDRQPTKEEIQLWCTFKDANIAIACGKQSGVLALDFDETDPELIKLIEPLLPESPVERIGSKGFVRFFQYNGEPTQNVWVKDDSQKNGKRIVLEILSHGKKVTIAPSIHPKINKPYYWTGKGLLDVDIKDLPKLPPMLVSHLQSKLQMLETTNYQVNHGNSNESRNLSLSSHVAKMIKSPHTILGAVQDLINFDKNNHKQPLFTDKNEQEFKNTELNSLVFYLNHLKSINSKRVREGKELEIPIMNAELALIDRLTTEDKGRVGVKLPTPTGLIKEVYDLILAKSYIEQPIFALSAAMSLIATLVSRKVLFQNTTANMYLLNIADSGSGKDSCQQVIKELLYDIKAGHKLLGATSYPSEASIINNIDVNPVRLDIIDECSTFLSAATKGGNSYAIGIGDTLCELYSCANNYYLGKSLASSTVHVGAVHRPHINLLCSTTYRGLHESISITSLEKGLFARFLVFFGENNKAGKRVLSNVKPSQGTLDKLKYWFDFKHPTVKEGNFTQFNTPAYKMNYTRKANDLLTQYHAEFDKMRTTSKSDSVHRPIIARLYQHMLKVTLVSAIGNTEVGAMPIVKPVDVEFGYQMVKYYFENISDFVKDNLYESQREMKANKVLKIIKDASIDGLSNSQLAERCRFLNTSERVDIIKDLKEANRIAIKVEEGKESSYRFYYIGMEE